MTSRLFPLIRKIHFFTAAAIAVLLVFYATSAWIMEYDEVFPFKKHTETEHVNLQQPAPAFENDQAARSWALAVARELDLPGRLSKVVHEGKRSLRADFNSPNRSVRLLVPTGSRKAELERTRYGIASAINRLHQFRGTNGSLVHFVWALLVDAVALIMILFSLSGIYLWYVADRDVLGFLLLITGAVFVGASVVFFA